MTVWIVSTGENYEEGGHVVAVYESRPPDSTVIGSVKPCLDEWEGLHGGRWTDGCDWLAVEEHEVKP